MPSAGFTLEFYLNVPPSIVMILLTDSKTLSEWSGAEALLERRVGGKMVLFDGWVEGKVLRLTDMELAYSWKPSDWPEEIRASQVNYTLTEEGNGTRIILDHSGFPNSKEMESHKSGWSEQFFDLISQYLQR